MPDKLTKHRLRSLKKANARRVQRVQLRQLRGQRATERTARRARPPRRKDWWEGSEEEPTVEKIRTAKPVVATPPADAPPQPPPEAVGTVIEVRSSDSLVMFRGQTIGAALPPGSRALDPVARSPLAVGDRVELEPIGVAEARIVSILPRSSALTRDIVDPTRRDPTHKQQVLAANIDQAIIVCSPAEPPFRPGLIDRYLVAASRDDLPAVIWLNKVDLGVPDAVESSLQGYAGFGIRVVRTSAITGAGLDDAEDCIAGKVSLFTGHSGVGKSSLLNVLEPGLSLMVGEVTQATAGQGKGRHTTSSARLIPLSLPDTFVVDSPGIRAFGIRGTDAHDLAHHFSDIAELAPRCSFRDCLHRGEPGCAVAARAKEHPFLRQRLESYRGMLRELR